MTQYHFKNFELLDPEREELGAVMNFSSKATRSSEVSAKPIKAPERERDRLRPAHADAGPDRQPRARGALEVSLPRLEHVPLT
jgi:hypothetical protein